MKTLNEMTNEELVKYYENLQEAEYQDYKMDMSGDCGRIISKHYEPLYEALSIEFEKRDLQMDDWYEDMPEYEKTN